MFPKVADSEDDPLADPGRPYDLAQPVVCIDEKPATLHATLRPETSRAPDARLVTTASMSAAAPPMLSVR
jgi:hypothetical protein